MSFRLNFLQRLKFNEGFKKKVKAQTFKGAQVDADLGQFRITTLVHDKSIAVPITGRHLRIEQKVNGKWELMKRVKRIAFDVTPSDYLKLIIEQEPVVEAIGELE